jgi:putative protein-disulfide isomerase
MKPLLIYCYDAYCGWCYGFSPVIKQVYENYQHQLDFEVLSGGMIPAEKPAPIGRMASYIAEAYKNVEALTGIKFGEDYLWHIFNPDLSDWFPASEKPAIALCIFKDYRPGEAVLFAADLQYALHFEGRDLCDDEAYRHLLHQYGMEADDFYSKLKSEEYKEKAYYEFALCKQLQVSGFPAVLLQAADQKFYLVARGYTSYAELSQRIDQVLASLAASTVE